MAIYGRIEAMTLRAPSKSGITVLLFAICESISSTSVNAQVLVNNQDLNVAVEIFELYAFKKPFSTKECYFVNFGQDRFKLHFYDHKTQAVFDAEGKKFEKGEWLRMLNYLRVQGWRKADERTEKLGNNEGRVVTFERIPTED